MTQPSHDPWYDNSRFRVELATTSRSAAPLWDERFPLLPPHREVAALRRIALSAPVREPVKRRKHRPATPCTYLIGIENSQLVKIGYTGGDPKRRLAELQTGQPMQMSLLWSCVGNYEADLHVRFDPYHHRGEWFDLSPLGDPVETVQAAVQELKIAELP
jgi:hypothetical protein